MLLLCVIFPFNISVLICRTFIITWIFQHKWTTYLRSIAVMVISGVCHSCKKKKIPDLCYEVLTFFYVSITFLPFYCIFPLRFKPVTRTFRTSMSSSNRRNIRLTATVCFPPSNQHNNMKNDIILYRTEKQYW